MKALYIAHIKVHIYKIVNKRIKTHVNIEQPKYPVILNEDGSIDDCDKQRTIRTMFREKMKQTNQTKKADTIKDYKVDFKIISYSFSSKIYQ